MTHFITLIDAPIFSLQINWNSSTWIYTFQIAKPHLLPLATPNQTWFFLDVIRSVFFNYICLKQGRTNDWIPRIVFATVALITGVLALFLPETLNRALPDTIEEIESWTHENLPRKQSKQNSDNNKFDRTRSANDIE